MKEPRNAEERRLGRDGTSPHRYTGGSLGGIRNTTRRGLSKSMKIATYYPATGRYDANRRESTAETTTIFHSADSAIASAEPHHKAGSSEWMMRPFECTGYIVKCEDLRKLSNTGETPTLQSTRTRPGDKRTQKWL